MSNYPSGMSRADLIHVGEYKRDHYEREEETEDEDDDYQSPEPSAERKPTVIDLDKIRESIMTIKRMRRGETI